MPAHITKQDHHRVIMLILVYVMLVYSNTFQIPFLFDDHQNILDRTELRLTHITPATVIDTFFTTKFGPKELYRPISCLSFALNYRIGGYRVSGYHMVNLLIHLIAAFFLYKIIWLLLRLGNLRLSDREKFFIAGLSTVLWASHPIQTQAVNYIVQRMASLSAMFYIIGLWSYIKYRQKYVLYGWRAGIKWLLMTILSFAAAIFSKENAAIFPVGLLLIELFFFDGYEKIRKRPWQISFFAGVLLLIPIGICYFFLKIDLLSNVLSGYAVRPFTLTQRLLTEPRVLFLYISQLFYPIPSRFSLVHYLPFSNSLFSPFTTLLAIAGIFTIIIIAFIYGKKYPLITFPIVFYFGHHIVESSVIPLEMIYEHRNYLPSFFFFLPIAIVFVKAIQFYRQQNRFIWGLLIVFSTSIIFFTGISTHMRNQEWKSAKSFWTKELKTTPELIRPYLAMGWIYTRPDSRNLELAFCYFREGIEKKEYFRKFEKGDVWLNIAKIYQEKNEYEKAKTAALKSLQEYKDKIHAFPVLFKRGDVKKRLASIYKTLADISAYTDAEKSLWYIEKAIDLDDSTFFYGEKAVYLITLNKPNEALSAIQKAFRNSDENGDALLIAAYLYTFKGEYKKGYWFYQRYLAQEIDASQKFQPIYLYMAENRYLARDNHAGDQYLNKFIQTATLQQISSIMRKINNHYPKTLPFINKSYMADKLSQLLENQGNHFVLK